MSRVVIEDLRKEISIQTSLMPILQENTSQVDDNSLPNHSGRIVDTSTDDEPQSGPEPAQHVAIDTIIESVSS